MDPLPVARVLIVEIRQLDDDLRVAPVREIQAGVGEHLLGHPGPAGICLAEGRADVIRRRQLQQGSEVREQAKALGSTPETEPDQATGSHHSARLNQRVLASPPDPVKARRNVEAVVIERQGEHVTDPKVTSRGAGPRNRDQRLGGI